MRRRQQLPLHLQGLGVGPAAQVLDPERPHAAPIRRARQREEQGQHAGERRSDEQRRHAERGVERRDQICMRTTVAKALTMASPPRR